MNETPHPDRALDCTGLFCPLPIVKTKLEIDAMQPGQVLAVAADDPGFFKDLPAWCASTGHECLGVVRNGAVITGYVRKK